MTTKTNSCLDVTESTIARLAKEYASREISGYPTTQEAFMDGFYAAIEMLAHCSGEHAKLKLISEV